MSTIAKSNALLIWDKAVERWRRLDELPPNNRYDGYVNPYERGVAYAAVVTGGDWLDAAALAFNMSRADFHWPLGVSVGG